MSKIRVLGLVIALAIFNGCISEKEKINREKEKIDLYNKENIIGTWLGVEENYSKLIGKVAFASYISSDLLLRIIKISKSDVSSNKLQFTENNNLIYSSIGETSHRNYNDNGGTYDTYSKYGVEEVYKYQINGKILNLNCKKDNYISETCDVPSYYNIIISKDTLYVNIITDSLLVDIKRSYYKMFNDSYTNSEKDKMTNEFMNEAKKVYNETTFKFYKL